MGTFTLCIVSSHHISFHCYIFYYIFLLFFYKELNDNKYHYCAIFVQSLSAYTLTNRYKRHLVKDDLY